MPATLQKKPPAQRCVLVNFPNFFKNIFFIEHRRVTASFSQ